MLPSRNYWSTREVAGARAEDRFSLCQPRDVVAERPSQPHRAMHWVTFMAGLSLTLDEDDAAEQVACEQLAEVGVGGVTHQVAARARR